LTQKILQQLLETPGTFNFKGFLLGNPLTNNYEN